MNNDITQWEYKRISYNTTNDSELDLNMEKLGKEGWELTGTLSASTGGGRLIFKRPKTGNYEYSR